MAYRSWPCFTEWGSQGLNRTVLCTLQERRLKAERTGQMIDLTKDVSPTVLAQTAAKLEAEQKQRDEDEAQKELAEARKPFEARMVSCLRQEWQYYVLLPATYVLPMCAYMAAACMYGAAAHYSAGTCRTTVVTCGTGTEAASFHALPCCLCCQYQSCILILLHRHRLLLE